MGKAAKPKAPKPLEKDIQRAILGFLKAQRGLTVWPNKSVGVYDAAKGIFRKPVDVYHRNGVSDILGFFHKTGRILAIEVKRPGGKISPDQLSFINEVNEGGGLAFIAYSVEDVAKQLLERK